ncbi:MAG: A/G-specific adenine glycosylase [Candidatus Kerfeldbacteria bacterium]|nr:A/G-specific adenine glycosylase [Candidatus Kerfeldbacteria bacterium]
MKSLTLSTQSIQRLRKNLLNWYGHCGRNLPWRQTHNPYRILISEVMLQQTQVDRVRQRYRQWLQQFPTVQHLATAPTAAVLRAWSGLGYNRRALALQHTAKMIVAHYHGKFPQTIAELQTLPGIGRYTASAIAAFAFAQPVAIMDTNVKRVLGRILLGWRRLAELRDDNAAAWALTEQVVPTGTTAYNFNQGLMDFGALVCTAKAPRCPTCPMRRFCKSYPDIGTASSDQLRVKSKRTEPLFFGQPRRIWRGKILQFLQYQSKPSVGYTQIGRAIQADWSSTRLPWLKQVLQSMINDGLIRQQRNRIALPK